MLNTNINIPTLKVLLTPILIMLVTIVLFIVSFRIFSPRISSQISNTQEIQTDVNNLEAKVETLKSFSSDIVNDRSDITYIILPDVNPAAAAITQIRSVLNSIGVETPSKVSLSRTTDNNGSNSSSITFEFETDTVSKVYDVLVALQNIAPIMVLEDVEIKTNVDTVDVNMSVSIYWADLPTKLPNIDQPISQLNSVERNTFTQILGFGLPEYSAINAQPPSTDRQNPFN